VKSRAAAGEAVGGCGQLPWGVVMIPGQHEADSHRQTGDRTKMSDSSETSLLPEVHIADGSRETTPCEGPSRDLDR